MNTETTKTVAQPAAEARCTEHPAYEADYCPICGTANVISTTSPVY